MENIGKFLAIIFITLGLIFAATVLIVSTVALWHLAFGWPS